jgi:hypothetical protein
MSRLLVLESPEGYGSVRYSNLQFAVSNRCNEMWRGAVAQGEDDSCLWGMGSAAALFEGMSFLSQVICVDEPSWPEWDVYRNGNEER